ncbi:hypothetical protein [Candidatus Rariloculus sp.]
MADKLTISEAIVSDRLFHGAVVFGGAYASPPPPPDANPQALP